MAKINVRYKCQIQMTNMTVNYRCQIYTSFSPRVGTWLEVNDFVCSGLFLGCFREVLGVCLDVFFRLWGHAREFFRGMLRGL